LPTSVDPVKATLSTASCVARISVQSAVGAINRPNRHQPKKSPSHSVGARVDEGRMGGPSWSPASCSPGSHLGGTRSHPQRRATMKAHPSTPHRPRPYGSPGLLPDFPTEVDAYWTTLAVVLFGLAASDLLL